MEDYSENEEIQILIERREKTNASISSSLEIFHGLFVLF